MASVHQSNGIADERGHYSPVIYAGCETRERAEEIKKSLYRSRNFCTHGNRKLSVKADVVKADDGSYQVHYEVMTREAAKQAVMDKYGDDVTKWPYNPFNKKEKK